MVSDSEDLAAIRECCEQQELLTTNGGVSVDVYKQLLLIYLIENDLVNAKFLWKRIPPSLKSADNELQCIWKICQYLWKRDFSNVYLTAQSEEWSALAKPLIQRLCKSLRQRMLELVVQAYSIIKMEELGKLLGLVESDVIELATCRFWDIDYENKVIKPKEDSATSNIKHLETFDELMNRLTDYVAFLEN